MEEIVIIKANVRTILFLGVDKQLLLCYIIVEGLKNRIGTIQINGAVEEAGSPVSFSSWVVHSVVILCYGKGTKKRRS